MFHFMLKTSYGVQNLSGKWKHQVTSLRVYSCFVFDGRHLGRLYAGVTYPLLKWTGLEHVNHFSSTMPNNYFGQKTGRAVFPVESAVGKLGWLNVRACLKPFDLNTPLPLFAVLNILLRTVCSNGNTIELSGLEKTSWGHLAPSANLNMGFQHELSQNKAAR